MYRIINYNHRVALTPVKAQNASSSLLLPISLPKHTTTMTRSFVLMAFLCAGTMSTVAQATYSTITINKKMQPGLVLDLPNTTEVAEGTLLQKLKETGYTPETSG